MSYCLQRSSCFLSFTVDNIKKVSIPILKVRLKNVILNLYLFCTLRECGTVQNFFLKNEKKLANKKDLIFHLLQIDLMAKVSSF